MKKIFTELFSGDWESGVVKKNPIDLPSDECESGGVKKSSLNRVQRF